MQRTGWRTKISYAMEQLSHNYRASTAQLQSLQATTKISCATIKTQPSRVCVCVCVCCHFILVWLFATLWTVAHQAPPSMGFSRQEYWSRLSCPPPGNLPDPRDRTCVPYVSCIGRCVLYHQLHLRNLYIYTHTYIHIHIYRYIVYTYILCRYIDIYYIGIYIYTHTYIHTYDEIEPLCHSIPLGGE